MLSPRPRELVLLSLPALRVIVEAHPIDTTRTSLVCRELPFCEFLSVFAKKALQEIRRKVTYIVPTNALLDQTELFEVTPLRDLLTAKIGEDLMQVIVNGTGELSTQAASSITGSRKAQPVLPNLRKPVPCLQQPRCDSWLVCLVAKELKIANNLFMEPTIGPLAAVEKQKRIHE